MNRFPFCEKIIRIEKDRQRGTDSVPTAEYRKGRKKTAEEVDPLSKKTWFILIAAILLLFAVSAGAESRPVNPDFRKVLEHDRQSRALSEEKGLPIGGAAARPVTISRVSAPSLDGTPSWKVSCDTRYGKPVAAIAYLSMKDFSSDYTTVWVKEYSYVPSTVSACRIVSGGSYEFSVLVLYSGVGYYADTDRFSVADDSAHTSLTEKVAQVANKCKAQTDWETAFNLHQWLVTNVYYYQDSDGNPIYNYYGADMILRGYGVCDGYSKAFAMLCKKAGLDVRRVVNSEHAWNAVKLDEKWYYVDCTWDDPLNGAGKNKALSGDENLEYFCLNEPLLALDHPGPWEYTAGSRVSCTALDANYLIHSGQIWNWGEYRGSYDINGFEVDTYSQAIIDMLAQESTCYIGWQGWGDCDDFAWYPTGPGEIKAVYMSARNKALLAYALSITTFNLDSEPVTVRVEDYANVTVVKLAGWKIEETGTLTTPMGLRIIPQGAFEKNNATTLEVQKGCEEIQWGAFMNSKIRTVMIPDSVTWIAPDAFDSCGRIIMITDNEYARGYAHEHNMIVADP